MGFLPVRLIEPGTGREPVDDVCSVIRYGNTFRQSQLSGNSLRWYQHFTIPNKRLALGLVS